MPRDTFDRDLDTLKKQLLQLGMDAGRTIGDGISALTTRDAALAKSMIAHDADINRVRFEIEERCYVLMATQQPLARDLREIMSILLIAIELERIADHSKNLAEIVLYMREAPLLKLPAGIPRMGEVCQSMLEQALDAFAHNDAEMGRAVCNRDDEIDILYEQVYQGLFASVADDPIHADRTSDLLFAAHNLDRIGDRITNIGERVIYAATGRLEELNVEKRAT